MKLFVDKLPNDNGTRINFLGRNAIVANDIETSSVNFSSLIDKFKQENSATHPQIIEDTKRLSDAVVEIDTIVLQITNKNAINLVESLEKFSSIIKSISYSKKDPFIYKRCSDLGINLKSLSYLQKICKERGINWKFFKRINIIDDFKGLQLLLLHVLANTFGKSFIRDKNIYLLSHNLLNLIDKPITSINYLERFISLNVMLFSCSKINSAVEIIRSINKEDIDDNGDKYLSRQKRYIFGNALISLGENAKELRDHLLIVESKAFSVLLMELGNIRDLVKVRPQLFITYSKSTSALLQVVIEHDILLTEVFKYTENFIKSVFLTKYLNTGLLEYIVHDENIEDVALSFKNYGIEDHQVNRVEIKLQTLWKNSVQLCKYEQKLVLLFLSNLLDQASIKDGAETRRIFDTALEDYTADRRSQVDCYYPIFNEDTSPQDIIKAINQYKLNKEMLRLAGDLKIVIDESHFQEEVFSDIMRAIPKSKEIKKENIYTSKLIINKSHREVLLFSQSIVGTRYFLFNVEKEYPNYCGIIRKIQHPLLSKTFKDLRDVRMNYLMHGDNEDLGDYSLLESSRSLTTAWIEDVKALKIIITSDIESIRKNVIDASDIDQLALVAANFVKYYESLSKFEEGYEKYEEYLNALVKKFDTFSDKMSGEHYKSYAELLHNHAYYLYNQGNYDEAIKRYCLSLDIKKKHDLENKNSIASTQVNLLHLLKISNRQLEYKGILASSVGNPALEHAHVLEVAESMLKDHKIGEAECFLRKKIKEYEATQKPIFQFHLLLAETYFQHAQKAPPDEKNQYLNSAEDCFKKTEECFDYDQNYLIKRHGQKYLEYYADFIERYCDFLMYTKKYNTIIIGLIDAFEKFDNAKIVVHNRELLAMYLLEASIYQMEDKFHSDIQSHRITEINQVEIIIIKAKAFVENINSSPIAFKQRTFFILYNCLNSILVATINKLDENQLTSIPNIFKTFAKELIDIIKEDKVTDININLKETTLEFLSMAAIYYCANEEAVVYLEELIKPEYTETKKAKYLRFLGIANFSIAKDIVDSRVSDQYKLFVNTATQYFKNALDIEHPSQNIDIINSYLEKCRQLTPIDDNSINILSIKNILIRKIGISIATYNIQIVKGYAPIQSERIKVDSFELNDTTITDEDLEMIKDLISNEIREMLIKISEVEDRIDIQGLISIEILNKKVVVVFQADLAIKIYYNTYN